MVSPSKKGLRNFALVSLPVVVAIAFLASVMVAQSQVSRTADDFFVKLIENRADLSHGTAIFEFRNPLATSISASAANFKLRLVEQPGMSPTTGIRYYVLENVSYADNVTDYSLSCVNATTANGTVTSCNKGIIGWHWNNYTVEKWNDFTNSGYVFNPGQTYMVKVEATWSPQTSGSREWFPQVIVGADTYEQSKWAWWNVSWLRKASITIDNTQNSNALSNYQLGINLTYDADMQPDFSDIRFANNTETGELSYWIEKQSNSNWAYAWVKVDSIPASSTTAIYVYYGNDTAVSTTSNGNSTFIFFDDFSGTLNTTKWNQSASMLSVAGGYLKIDNPPSGIQSWGTTQQFTFSGNIGKRVVYSQNSSSVIGNDIGFWNRNYGAGSAKGWHTDNSGRIRACSDDDCVNITWTGAPVNWVGSAFTKFNFTGMSAQSGNITQNSSSYNVTGTQPTGILNLAVGSVSTSGWHVLYFDYIAVANFTWPEPTYSIGTEQQIAGGINETLGRNAIVDGIQNSLIGAQVYTNQQIYVRYLNGTQQLGRFDKAVSSGSQVWAFNYVTNGETATNMANITPAFYVLETNNMTYNGLQTLVSSFINQTKT